MIDLIYSIIALFVCKQVFNFSWLILDYRPAFPIIYVETVTFVLTIYGKYWLWFCKYNCEPFDFLAQTPFFAFNSTQMFHCSFYGFYEGQKTIVQRISNARTNIGSYRVQTIFFTLTSNQPTTSVFICKWIISSMSNRHIAKSDLT